jgi:broad specificity phosphatase PhoE
MGKYYLIRHGETEANRTHIMAGHLDVHLSQIGRSQAERTGQELAGTRLDAVFSSDLSRARETAEAIMQYQQCNLILDNRLRDLHGGIFQGKPLKQLKDWWENQQDRFTSIIPNGESSEMVFQRACRSFDDICSWYPNTNIAIVAHQAVIRYILQSALGIDVKKRDFEIHNCSISILSGSPKEWTLLKADDISHL